MGKVLGLFKADQGWTFLQNFQSCLDLSKFCEGQILEEIMFQYSFLAFK